MDGKRKRENRRIRLPSSVCPESNGISRSVDFRTRANDEAIPFWPIPTKGRPFKRRKLLQGSLIIISEDSRIEKFEDS